MIADARSDKMKQFEELQNSQVRIGFPKFRLLLLFLFSIHRFFLQINHIVHNTQIFRDFSSIEIPLISLNFFSVSSDFNFCLQSGI